MRKKSHHARIIILSIPLIILFLTPLAGQSQTIGEVIHGSSYTNPDTIASSAEGGDDTSVYDVWGLYSDHDLDSLENASTGQIEALG